MPRLTLVLERKPVRVYDINTLGATIGRGSDNDIVIDNASVSRHHARIQLDDSGRWVVHDRRSANGILLNQQPLETPQALKAGDEISFGKVSLIFERELVDGAAAPAAAPRVPTGRPDATFHMNPGELAELQRAMARKRQAQLQWEAAGQRDTYYLDSAESASVLVGRSDLCDLRVPDGPRHHVLLTRTRAGVEVRNLSIWHRMRVNGQVCTRGTLTSRDAVEVGGLRFTFLDELI